MEVIFKSRNGRITERQRTYIEEKLGKLERYLEPINQATVEVFEEQHRNDGNTHRVQVTLVGEHGVIVRAEQRGSDLYSAIDVAHDTLQRQIQRFKAKRWRHGRPRRQSGEVLPNVPETYRVPGMERGEEDEGETEAGPQIVRTKAFQVKPMSDEEAVEQMELLGHDFFVFRNAGTNEINVLYRRKDGNYGLIVPGA